MNVMYVIGSLQLGGAERALMKLVNNLPRDKITPTIVTLFDLPDQFVLDELSDDIEVIELNMKPSRGVLRGLFKLRKIIKEKDIEIVHSFMFHANMFSRLCCVGKKVKLINSIRMKNLYKSWYDFFEKYTSFLVDIYTPNSQATKEFMLKKGFSKKKIRVIENAVDSNNLEVLDEEKGKLRDELGLDEPWNIVFCEANLRKQKDIPTTLRAIAEVIKEKEIYYIHAGGSNVYHNELEDLKRLVRKLKIEKYVKFLGYRKDSDKLLSICDVWTFSTLFEGQSNALLQAMSAGKPIVCTNIEENVEVARDRREALTFPTGDHKKQAELILRILNDEKLRDFLGKNAKERVEKEYSISNNIQKTLELYEELCAE